MITCRCAISRLYQQMLRRHSIHPQEEEASFTFLSDSGDLSYLPAGHTAVLPHSSIDDNRVPRSIAISTSSTRSLSVPAVASLEEPGTPRRPSCQPSDGLSNEARLGLPEKWFIYPVSRHGGRSSRTPDRKHDDIDFVKFDFTRPLEFCLSADSSSSTDTLPAYRSRTNSSGQLEDTLPPYPVDDKLSSVVQAIYAQNADLLKKPKLKRARPLPRDFTEHELREIRRKTRHRIRVLIFLAITLNNDDFLVLTHEMVSAHSETITPMLHELPGFSHAHHAFMLPIEKIQEALGLSTMAQRAVDFGAGGWYDPADVVLKNMFLVGAVQMAMETAIDQVQDRFSRAVENVKEHQAHKRISRLRECQTEGVAWSKNTDFLFKIRHDL
ncbi:hypothetical protein D6D28_06677 [Aureobasidium pullulans]|uniref:Uncharacterized protein n=1 Tax=Aureobasidium pullulans TaxID=5580 RepID=A0A4S8SD96_AURPU|nr:hypothetical protein D6D28_06677 [Aureobasidium pullulans]